MGYRVQATGMPGMAAGDPTDDQRHGPKQAVALEGLQFGGEPAEQLGWKRQRGPSMGLRV